MGKPVDLVQGTLDLLILKAIGTAPIHGWAIAQRINQLSSEVLRVQQGSLYPALQRLEREGWIRAEWGASENNRRARFYSSDQGRPETSRARAGGLGTAGRRDRAPAADARDAMRSCRESLATVRGSFRPGALDAEVAEELRFHLERQIEANLDAGMSPDEATRAAHLTVGSLEVDPRGVARGPARRAAAPARPRPDLRAATAAPGARLCRDQRAGRRARHRHHHRDFQRRLRRDAAAAAVRRAGAAGGDLDPLAE